MNFIKSVESSKNTTYVYDVIARLKDSIDKKTPSITFDDIDYMYRERKLFSMDIAIILVRNVEVTTISNRIFVALISNGICIFQLELINCSISFEHTNNGNHIIIKNFYNRSIAITDYLYIAEYEDNPKYLDLEFKPIATPYGSIGNILKFKKCIGFAYAESTHIKTIDVILNKPVTIYHPNDNTEFTAISVLSIAHKVKAEYIKYCKLYLAITKILPEYTSASIDFDEKSITEAIYQSSKCKEQIEAFKEKVIQFKLAFESEFLQSKSGVKSSTFFDA